MTRIYPNLKSLKYQIHKLDPSNVDRFAGFLYRIRSEHWSLTSSAHERQPSQVVKPSRSGLLEAESDSARIGTYLLERDGRVLGSLCLDYTADRESIVFSKAEADPAIQRRGLFAILLARPCFLAAMSTAVSTFQMTTWSFNRKAFPLYAKAGFRAVPDTNVALVSFLPLLFRFYSERFGSDPRSCLDEHIPEATRSGGQDRDRVVIYPYAWRLGLRADVVRSERTGSISIRESFDYTVRTEQELVA